MSLSEQTESQVEGVDQPPSPPVGSAKNWRWLAGGGAAVLAIAIVGTLGGMVYRVYAATATDRWTLGLARFLRLPAFKVNGIFVPYTDYVEDLKAIRVLREAERKSGGPGATLSEAQMSDQVLLRLVNIALVAQAARDRHLTVEGKDVADLKNQLLKQFSSVDQVEVELGKRYGWNLATYENKVMRPLILQQKLARAYESDEPARAATRQQAEAVLTKLKAGDDFAALAKQYGQDGTAAAGGDLGWFGRGVMVPQFEAAAFALKPGALSSEPVESPFGFHIIKVEDRKTARVKDAEGKMANQEQVRARHILFRFPSLESYLDEALQKARVEIYLKIHNPFSTSTSSPGRG